MRRYILILVIAVFTLLISFFAYSIIRKNREHRISYERISRLPQFSFTTLEGASFSSCKITEGPVLIVRFHPECEHCQYEISEILKSKIQASGVKVLLISGAGREMVIEFLDQFNLSEKQGVVALLDTAFVFREIFGKDFVPSNYIYDKDLKLVKQLFGEYKIESILNYLDLSE